MKKILIIVFIASCFGCSKSSDVKPNTDTWITGKWKATTRYSYNQSTQKQDTVTISNELTFSSNSAYESGSNLAHSYTLGEVNSINIYSGDCPIVKQSSTRFLLKWQFTDPGGTIYNNTDVYIKE